MSEVEDAPLRAGMELVGEDSLLICSWAVPLANGGTQFNLAETLLNAPRASIGTLDQAEAGNCYE